jgi:peptide-methionine (S)-S-oxide reductase
LGQGNDVGPQYRSVILFHDAAQQAVAESVMAEITAEGIWGATLVTELVPFDRYWPGEPEHQDYFARTPWSGYCQVVIAPKVAKFRKLYAARLKRTAA